MNILMLICWIAYNKDFGNYEKDKAKTTLDNG